MTDLTINTNSSSEEVVVRTPYLRRDSIYVGYNRPGYNEFHRTIFITHPSHLDGTMHHAIYNKDTDSWSYERRDIVDLSKARRLAVLYRIASLPSGQDSEEWFSEVDTVLASVDMDRNRVRSCDTLERLQISNLGGYSCIVWLVDAVQGLVDKGLVVLKDGFSVEEELMVGRLIAGPEVGTLSVAIQPGPLKVVDERKLTEAELERFCHWLRGDRRVRQ
ncbi:hypothetical protein HYALB_00008140 [Hymenoscyphus albidus]|uniref:Uncharacterized protein n=1 Tax=Hymenoscyphus albidus TaxID=595503 RepID=A0A9N9PXV5_9HELO|nr:hypothetical protein HYALB_00008140 [Hymenoscyphus albidus]